MAVVRDKLGAYYYLTKPGIIRGNLFAAAAGFLLAAKGTIRPGVFAAAMTGTALTIACGCVLNNYIDRNIDAKMARTKKRALVSGVISSRAAIVFAIVLGLAGLGILWTWANMLTVALGIMGLFFYVAVYGVGKRHTVHSTLIGSISGALPPVAGYTAASNQLDTGAFLLFLMLAAWQMPHFYAIAMFRRDEYAAAGLPILPIKKGMHATKVQIQVYIVIFTVLALLLTVFGYTGYTYAALMLVLGTAWFYKGARTWRKDDITWARGMFFVSLSVLVVLCILLAIAVALP